MKRKLLLLAFLFLVGGWPAFAQLSASGTISSSGTTCATASACVVLNLQANQGSASITVGGTFSGTLQFEIAGDNQAYVAVNAYPPNSTTAVTSTTSTGTWTVSTAGMTNLRVRASALASGSATVTLQSSQAMTAVNLPGGGGGSGTVTSIATTGPITGGTIITTGTLACGTCVVASSPGAGIAHFAGSTQTVTSSAINLAADVTGQLPISGVGSSGLSGTAPVTISAAGAIGCATCAIATNINSFTAAGLQDTGDGLGLAGAGDTEGWGFWLYAPGVFGHILVNVNTADASNNYEFGIYNASGTLVCHTTSGAVSSTEYLQIAFSSSCTLAAGQYFVAFGGATATTLVVTEGASNIVAFAQAQLSASYFPGTITPPTLVYQMAVNSTFRDFYFSLVP